MSCESYKISTTAVKQPDGSWVGTAIWIRSCVKDIQRQASGKNAALAMMKAFDQVMLAVQVVVEAGARN